ncbi:uncharacterized protein [Littorina saxatilis]|uniref:Uncharacterized protein n=1 Tax=Littorina saxatilis TaxID=31220 RepID=A0AAN9BY95_9CAEN
MKMTNHPSLTLASIAIVLILNAAPGATLCAELGFECHNDSFPCFRDCCVKGDQFCHAKRETCGHCKDRKDVCDSPFMPVECLLYCYKLQSATCNTGVRIEIVIAIGTVAVFLLVIVVFTCLRLRKTTREQRLQNCVQQQDRIDNKDDLCESEANQSSLQNPIHECTGMTTDVHEENTTLLCMNETHSPDQNQVDATDLGVTVDQQQDGDSGQDAASEETAGDSPNTTANRAAPTPPASASQWSSGNPTISQPDEDSNTVQASRKSTYLTGTPSGIYANKVHSIGRPRPVGHQSGHSSQTNASSSTAQRGPNYAAMSPSSEDASILRPLALDVTNPTSIYSPLDNSDV